MINKAAMIGHVARMEECGTAGIVECHASSGGEWVGILHYKFQNKGSAGSGIRVGDAVSFVSGLVLVASYPARHSSSTLGGAWAPLQNSHLDAQIASDCDSNLLAILSRSLSNPCNVIASLGFNNFRLDLVMMCWCSAFSKFKSRFYFDFK